MKILIIPSWFPSEYNEQNGIFFKEQAELLNKFGHEVTLINVQVNSLKRKKVIIPKIRTYKKEGVFYYHISITKWLPKSRSYQRHIYQKYLTQIFDQIKIKDFDIVHCHSFFNAGYTTIKYFKEKNIDVPVVLTEHSSSFIRDLIYPKEKIFIKKYFPYFNKVISVSEYLKESLEEYTDNEIKVIPNVVDTDFFRNLDVRKNNRKIVLSVGFLNKNKGMDLLLDAFYSVEKNIKGSQLRIVGDGPEYDILKTKIKDLGLEGKVKLLGKLDRDGVLKEMNEANIFATTSWNETFSVVIIEANATGLPVLATKSGGPNYLVKDYNGMLANRGDKQDIVEKMTYLLKNNSKFDQGFIRTETIKNYGAEQIIYEISRIYKEVANEKK